jgi:hypothetical protein
MSEWPWPSDLDGVLAAPASHRVLLDAPNARVLEVLIPPGAFEPEHTHRFPSVMIVDQPARIRYYEHGQLTYESPDGGDHVPGPRVSCLDAEGPHAVQNVDSHEYHAFRVELRR